MTEPVTLEAARRRHRTLDAALEVAALADQWEPQSSALLAVQGLGEALPPPKRAACGHQLADCARQLQDTIDRVQLPGSGASPASGDQRGERGLPDGVLDRHLRHLRLCGNSGTSIYQRRRALTRMAALIPVPLLEATYADLATWRGALDLGDKATCKYVSHALNFYRWAIAEGLCASNPAEGLPVPRVPRSLPRPIAELDLITAVSCAPKRIRPWLVLAGWSGLRAKEIALLQRHNVMDAIRPPVLLVASDATKGRRERIVPLAGLVISELYSGDGMPRSGYLFRRHDGGPGPNDPWTVSHLANKHLHSCGIEATLHQLRHRFGTMTYRACQDLRAVQEMMGHQNPTTTAGYAAYSPGIAIDAVGSLPGLTAGPQLTAITADGPPVTGVQHEACAAV